jgi:hypothetical protein
MWMIKTVLGSVRLRKGAVKRRTIRGTERHRGVLLKKRQG